ncbi:MAG: (d)CMP kinase [Desulfarculales bacterium]|nr:(d)CMP kinase [Desulfarculales bacterium]
MVITVDGPGGAGKSTVSRNLAARLNFAFLDTGAMYRAVALCALGEDAALADLDPERRKTWLEGIKLELLPGGVALDGRPVEAFIRNGAVASAASHISALPEVREYLLGRQRAAGRRGNLVAEGRDMGTVVFPEAELKFFLTASEEERARRRFKDMALRDPQLTLAEVRREMAGRDARDLSRTLAPLRPASEAIIIDSTGMKEEEVVALMLARAQKIAGVRLTGFSL